mgnify:CR=1 FL=1
MYLTDETDQRRLNFYRRLMNVLLTIFLSIVFCSAMAMALLAAVAFVQNEKFFSSAPKEVQKVIQPRENELFYGARKIGWAMMIISLLLVLGVGVISIWDGFRNNFTFLQFFIRFVIIFTVYKLADMVLIDYFLLLKFKFFQYYYPEASGLLEGKKYGFNIRSQLLKLFVIFPAVCALVAWICTLFQ